MIRGGFDSNDQRFMRRALALAARGRGSTRPNPIVGAVLVRDGKILAEGFHRRAGEPHAEAQALGRLQGRAPGATLYVNLEPCAHSGRTGPCADVVRSAGVTRVVVGVRDPNPLVDGAGIRRLRRAGVRVDVGCLEDECREVNRAFFVWVREGRPFVTLKVAATLDGFIADGKPRSRPTPAWITGEEARAAGHVLRAEHDAVLVGAGTVRADGPLLTVRSTGQKVGSTTPAASPHWRVVVDGRLATSPKARVLRTVSGSGGESRTIVIGSAEAPAAAKRARALESAGAEVMLVGPTGAGGHADAGTRLSWAHILSRLAERQIQSVLVEGGAEVHGQLIAAGLADRVAFFFAPKLLGGGIPIAAGRSRGLGNALRFGPLRVRHVGEDLLVEADIVGSPRGRAVPRPARRK